MAWPAKPELLGRRIYLLYLFIYLLFILKIFLPAVPVGFKETLDGWPPPVSSVGYIFCDALFLIVRLMLPAEAPCAYNVTVPSRMVS